MGGTMDYDVGGDAIHFRFSPSGHLLHLCFSSLPPSFSSASPLVPWGGGLITSPGPPTLRVGAPICRPLRRGGRALRRVLCRTAALLQPAGVVHLCRVRLFGARARVAILFLNGAH